jgi:hypothetical protein
MGQKFTENRDSWAQGFGPFCEKYEFIMYEDATYLRLNLCFFFGGNFTSNFIQKNAKGGPLQNRNLDYCNSGYGRDRQNLSSDSCSAYKTTPKKYQIIIWFDLFDLFNFSIWYLVFVFGFPKIPFTTIYTYIILKGSFVGCRNIRIRRYVTKKEN